MRYLLPAFAIGLVLAAPVSAGDEGLAGHWKLSIADGGQQMLFWLLHIDSKDGKLTIAADTLPRALKAKMDDGKLVGDTITFKMLIGSGKGEKDDLVFDFEAKLPKPGAKKIFGSLTRDAEAIPVILESTQAKNPFELDRETVLRTPSDPRALVAIFSLIDRAKENKIEPKELQEWVNSSLKSAEAYGPRFQMKHTMRLLEDLASKKMYASVAVETARKVVKQVDPKSPADQQLTILSTIADVLRNGDQKAEAEALEPRIDKLEGLAYTEYGKNALNYKVEKFEGRKGKSKRIVLVELFTGAQCPPCVAADMAFDGLEKTYKTSDVVLLQYHMHIPRPEPMSNLDAEARFDYYVENYSKKVRGTPSTLLNGKPDVQVFGGRADAPEKYKEYCEAVNKLLEAPATCKLSAQATRDGDKIDIEAKVADLDMPGDKIRLRLVLVEDWVRFKGANQMQYHHRVVRALPGGAKGVAVKGKELEHKVSIDLDDVRRKINKYLDDDYPDGPRPMRLRNLHVVAFVQDDATTEVLQAVNVAVRVEKK